MEVAPANAALREDVAINAYQDTTASMRPGAGNYHFHAICQNCGSED